MAENKIPCKKNLCRSLAVAALSIMAGLPAQAQQCDTVYEVIAPLRRPALGSYNLWDTVYGSREEEEYFVSGTLGPSGNAVVAGGRKKKAGGISLLLTERDRRGRMVWEKEYDVRGMIDVLKIMRTEKGYAVLARLEEKGRPGVKVRRSAWIGFFNEEGGKVREKIISDNRFGLDPQDMIEVDGGGYMLAVAATGHDAPGDGYAILYRLNSAGAVKEERAYVPGMENRILGLANGLDSSFYAVGYAGTDDGRKAGWVMKLAEDGAIIWQRIYARGRAARLLGAADYRQGYFLVAGASDPAVVKGDKDSAAWVMMLEGARGDVGWQRFYPGASVQEARQLLVHEDGQVSLLIDAKESKVQKKGKEKQKNTVSTEDGIMAHARVLTLSPRGEILMSDSYFEGAGAQVAQMFFGPNGERILAGRTNTVHLLEDPAHPEKEPEAITSMDGWVVAGTPAEPYEDRCVDLQGFMP